MADGRDQVFVHLDAPDLGPSLVVGTLGRERSASKTAISFSYEPDWVTGTGSFSLDPSLPLYQGAQYTSALPGLFTDAAPDRWGRTLLERREALEARRQGRKQRRLDDWDFLTGVNDLTRMGALRFARVSDGVFLDDGQISVPPRARLRDLEHWASEIENGLASSTTDEERWILMLIAPGSSLGGARPKANFLDDDGALWLAKFPSREDRHDVGAWEYLVTRLAARAGIAIPEVRILRLGSRYQTFCARRFDRSGPARRLYASAMTLVGRGDNEDASYLDVAQAIVRSADPACIADDLEQLYRRVVFNVMTANRDDHLRNHGFLRVKRGWRLSPAFDVNPSPDKMEHSLALNDAHRLPDLEIVRETAPFYRLSRKGAIRIIDEVRSAVAGWAAAARDAGIARDEIERFGTAFEMGGS